MIPDSHQRASLAYESVRGIQTVEPNDRERLGYHIYLYLTGEFESVTEAVAAARSRTIDTTERVAIIITERLNARGVIRT